MVANHLVHSRSELELIVSAAAVPMLIADYTPLLRRYAGLGPETVEAILADDDELMECLALPLALAVSQQWVDLYGSPLAAEAPDLKMRQFHPRTHPDLAESIRMQFLAPFSGETSIVREHTAPTMVGDVVVRSHWKAAGEAGHADYTRIVIVDHDVSDLRAAHQSLEDALSARDRLVATVGHELKHPVAAIIGFGEILRQDWDQLSDAERRELVDTVLVQADDMTVLIDDLMAASATHAMAVAAEPIELAEVLEGIDMRGVDLSIDQGVVVKGDPLRIRQIIRNLIGNARIHGGPHIRVAAAAAPHGTVTVAVTDDGPGVPADVATRLFELFVHGGDAGSFGIGLSVSRLLARAMGGDLLLTAGANPTTFELRLPGVAGSSPGTN